METAGKSGNLGVAVSGGNLFDISRLKEFETDNANYKTSAIDGKVIFTGKGTVETESIWNALNLPNKMLTLLPGKYILSFKSDQLYGTANTTKTVEIFVCVKSKEGKTNLRSTGSKGWAVFDVVEGDQVYFRFDINNSTIEAVFYDIMLNAGDTALPYETYHSQSLTLSTPNGLPGIPVSSGGNYTDAKGQQWVCDEIDLEREKYIERRWQKVFDGSEDWRIYSSSRFKGYMIDGILPFSDSRRAGFCNMFTVSENTEIIESIWLGVGNSILYTVSNRFYDESLEDKGLANWKAFLAENPMKVMTYLDTPIERGLAPEEIAAYKALRTYSPTTVVSNDAGCHMETTYTADTKTYINNKFAALNKTILDAVGGT